MIMMFLWNRLCHGTHDLHLRHLQTHSDKDNPTLLLRIISLISAPYPDQAILLFQQQVLHPRDQDILKAVPYLHFLPRQIIGITIHRRRNHGKVLRPRLKFRHLNSCSRIRGKRISNHHHLLLIPVLLRNGIINSNLNGIKNDRRRHPHTRDQLLRLSHHNNIMEVVLMN